MSAPHCDRAYYLSPPDFHRLDWACRPIAAAYGTPVYLVGSVTRTAAYRDIDLRLILPDEDVATMPDQVRLLTNIALSDLIARAANAPAPVDFQIQSMTEANVPEHGARNPIGWLGVPGRIR